MDLHAVTGTRPAPAAEFKKAGKKAEEKAGETKGFSDTAAVYERSDEKAASATRANKKSPIDRSAVVAQLKAAEEEQQSRLMDIVRNMMTRQGQTIGKADDMWRFLAKGDFTVDAATKAQAQADIADDGYWGVDQTSDRILDFAKALSGDDIEKADELLDAFKKGFKEATKSWGETLPDISQRTYDAVVKKFDAWKNGTESSAPAQEADTE